MNIWLHAVSVGETKAISTLVPHIRKEFPNAHITVTSITKTGHAEARRSIRADAHYMLPLDLPWIITPFVKRIKPDLFLLSETDYWPFLLRALKKNGCTTAVVSGKLSDKSYKRLRILPIAKWLYKNVDRFFLQTKEDKSRFQTLGIPQEKLSVTGNLKLSLAPRPLEDPLTFREFLGLSPTDRVITIGSTHKGEEKLILDHLKLPDFKIVVVPRHPERFCEVTEQLEPRPNVKVVDRMGILSDCYRISDLAIVGGSFVPIGGHDVLEPIKCGTPTLFGPHMDAQRLISQIALDTGYARQATLDSLTTKAQELLSAPKPGKATFPPIAENTWLQIKELDFIL